MTMAAVLAFLKRIPWQAWALLAVLAVAYGLLLTGERIGRASVEATVLAQKVTHDSILVVQYDTVVRHDTVRLSKTLAHFDTLRETLNVHDTVAVERFVVAADSAVRSCRETVSAFALSCSAKDTVIADLRRQVRIGLPPVSGGLSWKARAGWALVGAALGEGVRRLR